MPAEESGANNDQERSPEGWDDSVNPKRVLVSVHTHAPTSRLRGGRADCLSSWPEVEGRGEEPPAEDRKPEFCLAPHPWGLAELAQTPAHGVGANASSVSSTWSVPFDL